MNLKHHQKQWKYNEDVINWCKSNKFLFYDWLITIAFYTALHKIDYCLHVKAKLSDKEILKFNISSIKKYYGHKARNQRVIFHLREISAYYIDLYRECRRVRYNQAKLNQIDISDLENYLKIWFEIIKPYNPKKK